MREEEEDKDRINPRETLKTFSPLPPLHTFCVLAFLLLSFPDKKVFFSFLIYGGEGGAYVQRERERWRRRRRRLFPAFPSTPFLPSTMFNDHKKN